MLIATPRQQDIVSLAREIGRVDVDMLAERFNVTPQTIRKDLNDLCEQGVLHRYHGGAVLATGVVNFGYEARRQLATSEKRRIGVKAAALIPDNSSILINIGTTTEQVATALRGHRGLLVITNNINVVNILSGNMEIEVIIAGGVVRPTDGGVVGETAVDFIRQFKVDYAVIGASAIDEDGRAARLRLPRGQGCPRHHGQCPPHHPGRRRDEVQSGGAGRIGHLGEINCFVTDEPPPEPIAELCREHGVALEIADPA